ncbi:MAG: hypothetical protein PHV07_01655 [Oscillospiraceae bacterium]|nr:hypothetical protein [Oscillospiraceae bacterium]
MGEIIIPYLCFIVFCVIMHKQNYAARHFTGASSVVPVILLIYGLLDIAFCVYYLIKNAIVKTFLSSIILAVVAFIIILLANAIIARITMNNMKKSNSFVNKTSDTAFDSNWFLYNRKQDIITTIIANIGLIVNPILAIIILVL